LRYLVVFPREALNLFLSLLLLSLGFTLMAFPQPVFQAALRGLETWWDIVLPALFPFLVISQLFWGLGLVHFLGVMLEPLMRPLFKVPGSGSVVMAMGYSTGAPVSALLTAQLRQKGMLTRVEGERLMSFTSNASPLFMMGAVAVGMLQQPHLGPLLAGAHYGANLLVGLLMRFYGKEETSSPPTPVSLNLLSQAWKAMQRAHQEDPRPLGQLFLEAVNQAFQTLLTIGGYIVFFSVFLQALSLWRILPLLVSLFSPILKAGGLSPQLAPAIATGFFEMTLGTKMASEVGAPLPEKLMAISLIMGWAGLSIIGQVGAMISRTDLRLTPFILARFLHGILAALLIHFFPKPAVQVFFLIAPPLCPRILFSNPWPLILRSSLVLWSAGILDREYNKKAEPSSLLRGLFFRTLQGIGLQLLSPLAHLGQQLSKMGLQLAQDAIGIIEGAGSQFLGGFLGPV